MTLKEKVSKRYANGMCTTGNDNLDVTLNEIRAWAFEAGLEEGVRLSAEAADLRNERMWGETDKIVEAIKKLPDQDYDKYVEWLEKAKAFYGK